MSMGQTGHTRGCPAKILYVYCFLSFPSSDLRRQRRWVCRSDDGLPSSSIDDDDLAAGRALGEETAALRITHLPLSGRRKGDRIKQHPSRDVIFSGKKAQKNCSVPSGFHITPRHKTNTCRKQILGNYFFREYMRGLYSHSHKYRKIFLRDHFPHIIQILEGIHVGANTCRACIRTRANTEKYSWRIIYVLVSCQGMITSHMTS